MSRRWWIRENLYSNEEKLYATPTKVEFPSAAVHLSAILTPAATP